MAIIESDFALLVTGFKKICEDRYLLDHVFAVTNLETEAPNEHKKKI
jgi:hypothetical protein